MVIYKIQNKVNGKVYIGQTIRGLDTRVREHVHAAEHGGDFYLGCAIRKYGWCNFDVSVLAETDDVSELNKLERYYIEHYHSDVDGYNLAPGGDINVMCSPVVKAKHDAVMRSPEVRQRISATLSARIKADGRSTEYVQNMRAGFQQYLMSDKFKEDVKKRKLSPEHFKALNDAKNKKVYCIDASGAIVKEFDRVKDAAMWWRDSGYAVKSYDQLMDRIKESAKQDKFIRGLKWIYCV